MAIDRAGALRNAEKLLRQGKLDLAIAEYLRVVEDQPLDWNTANLLGDLYVRVGQTERAIAQLTRVADGLRQEGFLLKAGALYKKILRLDPDDEHALVQAAEVAAAQGLLVDARRFLHAVAEGRRTRGDERGVADMAVRLAALDSKRRDQVLDVIEEAGGLDKNDAALAGQVSPDAPAIAESPPIAQAQHRAEHIDVDRSVVLDRVQKPPDVPAPSVDIDGVFAHLRHEASRLSSDAGEQEFKKGMALLQAGQMDESLSALLVASRTLHVRLDAALAIGRILRDRGQVSQAIEWFERGAEAPAATPDRGHELLYELADALESIAEGARALAIYLELQADAGEFRDVAARVERLALAQARG